MTRTGEKPALDLDYVAGTLRITTGKQGRVKAQRAGTRRRQAKRTGKVIFDDPFRRRKGRKRKR